MRVILLCNYTFSAFYLRMELIQSFIENGHEVIVVGQDSDIEYYNKFNELGIKYYHYHVERTGINPFKDLKTIKDLKQIFNQVQPDVVFAYQAKAIIYGSTAGAKYNVKFYPLISGLGSILRGSGLKISILRFILETQYRIACRNSKKIFFQNHDDSKYFIDKKIACVQDIVHINGSGVNLDRFSFNGYPQEMCFLFIGRMMRDKGINEFLEASQQIKIKYPACRFIIVGEFDTNPTAIKKDQLQVYIDLGIVEFFGHQNDVRPFIDQASVLVLPSYHEGTPRVVLEAMAKKRPIITTNAPGCKETVIEGENGFMVDVRNIEQIVEKMEYLINNQHLIALMGQKSHELVKAKFNVDDVNYQILKTMDLLRSETND